MVLALSVLKVFSTSTANVAFAMLHVGHARSILGTVLLAQVTGTFR